MDQDQPVEAEAAAVLRRVGGALELGELECDPLAAAFVAGAVAALEGVVPSEDLQ